MGCHFLFQGIFPTQGLNPCFPHLVNGKVCSLPLSHLGKLFSKSPRVNANFYVHVNWGPKTLDDSPVGKRWHLSVLRLKPRTESKTSVLWNHKPCLKMEDRVFSTLSYRYENHTHQGSASCFFYLPLSEEEGGISVTLTQVKTEGPEINWVPILPAAHPTSKLWTSFSPFRAWSPSLFSEAVDTELLENLGTQCQLPGTCSIRITWDLLRTANPRSQLRPARTEPALNNLPG